MNDVARTAYRTRRILGVVTYSQLVMIWVGICVAFYWHFDSGSERYWPLAFMLGAVLLYTVINIYFIRRFFDPTMCGLPKDYQP